ncbi:MAG: HD family hydrolase [Candidatus Woesearchaeota archaeon]
MKKLRFLQQVMKLKHIPRTGWVNKTIPNPESVAGHVYGVAILALTVPLPKGINRNKLVQMALVHDLGEVHIGDAVWEHGKLSDENKGKTKDETEKLAVLSLFQKTGLNKVQKLVLEYIEHQSPTAKFLKELDKLDMILEALVYEERVHPQHLDEFWENAEKYINDKNILRYFEALKKERKKN